MTDPTDDLADLLGPRSAGPSPAFRDALLYQTERRLARDRWVRRGAKVAAVAAVFLAGGAAGWFARPSAVPVPGVVAAPVFIPVPVPTPAPPAPDPPRVTAPLSPSEAELRAEQADDPAEAARLYRTAGDLFLRGEDYPNATRCYRLFLARGGEAALTIDVNDSWLLVSLKNGAYKEKSHVPKVDG